MHIALTVISKLSGLSIICDNMLAPLTPGAEILTRCEDTHALESKRDSLILYYIWVCFWQMNHLWNVYNIVGQLEKLTRHYSTSLPSMTLPVYEIDSLGFSWCCTACALSPRLLSHLLTLRMKALLLAHDIIILFISVLRHGSETNSKAFSLLTTNFP